MRDVAPAQFSPFLSVSAFAWLQCTQLTKKSLNQIISYFLFMLRRRVVNSFQVFVSGSLRPGFEREQTEKIDWEASEGRG